MRTYKGMSDFHRLHYIESYLSSSQSLYGFCKQNGLPITRFKSWLRIFGVEKIPIPGSHENIERAREAGTSG